MVQRRQKETNQAPLDIHASLVYDASHVQKSQGAACLEKADS
jgi:hypothetical protein